MAVNIRVTTLCENTAVKSGFMAEWGLSILVEIDKYKVLFDTGASSVVPHNAQKLGIDLSSIDKIILSHGHIDHTGGLANILQFTGKKDVVLHPAAWESKYTKRPDEDEAAIIGINFTKEALKFKGAEFIYSREPVEIAKGVVTTGEVEMITDYEIIEPNLLVKRENSLQPDTLADDLSLIIDSPKGLIVISGCAHRGIINHLLHAQKLFKGKNIYAVVGGTHLSRASEMRIDKTISALKNLDIKKIGVSHCTGFNATCALAQAFGDRFFVNSSGTQCELL